MKHGRTEEWAKWRRLVSEQIASGQAVAAFCRDLGLRDWQFYDWKKRVREAGASKFVAVEVAAIAKQRPAATGRAIEVRLPRGRSIVIEPGFDAHHLRTAFCIGSGSMIGLPSLRALDRTYPNAK